MIVDDRLVSLAHRLADAAGAISRAAFRNGLDADDKSDRSPVTEADRAAEAAMRAILAAEAPEDGVIGEEHGRAREDAERVWVLDPIDGTKGFVAGKPLFTTLVALMIRGRFALGVIDQPVIGDRWTGAAGRPTQLGGAPARCRACPSLDRARLSTSGPEYFTAPELATFDRIAARARLVTYGGDGYQYGLVAMGAIDVVVECGLKLYDFAAHVPVVEGAGGVVTDWSGRPLGPTSAGDIVAAGDARVHAEVIALLRGPG